ncbi:MAG TPA: hypothetical protein VKN18_11185 [Blastocatellia bacterium]|nr:hypothetical protein [Blastocatellia bacterium]
MQNVNETINQLSCEQVIPTSDIVAATFYARLLEIDPELSFRFTDNLFERIRSLLKGPRDKDPSAKVP